MGGCGPSAPGPPRGLHAVESLAFYLFIFWPGLWPRNNMYVLMVPSVDCPGGPGLGAQPRRFQNGIRSAAASGRKRRGGKGRRPSLLGCFALGACLFLSLLRVRQAVSGCRRGGAAECPLLLGLGRALPGPLPPRAQPSPEPLTSPSQVYCSYCGGQGAVDLDLRAGGRGLHRTPGLFCNRRFLCANRLGPG